jgi:hypothetical protein
MRSYFPDSTIALCAARIAMAYSPRPSLNFQTPRLDCPASTFWAYSQPFCQLLMVSQVFETYVQPNTGHALNLHYNSTGTYEVMQNFVREHIFGAWKAWSYSCDGKFLLAYRCG